MPLHWSASYDTCNLLCRVCIDGFGSSLVSTGYACKNCTEWMLYILLERVPATVFYFVVLTLQILITSAPMNCFVMFSQLVIITVNHGPQFQGAVSHVTQIDSLVLRWPEMTRRWRHLTGSHLEVAVEGRKLAYTVHFTSYKVVARSKRQSRDRKWCNVTSGDRMRPGSDFIWLEVTWKWQWKDENSRLLCFTSYKAVARRRRQSRERKWRHVT